MTHEPPAPRRSTASSSEEAGCWRLHRRVGAATAACSTTATGHTTTSTLAGAIAITSANRPSAAEVKTCVTSQPAAWMACIERADSAFGRFPISALALPGSRNAGSYNLDPAAFDTQRGSSCTGYTTGDTRSGAEFVRWSELRTRRSLNSWTRVSVSWTFRSHTTVTATRRKGGASYRPFTASFRYTTTSIKSRYGRKPIRPRPSSWT